MAIIPKVSTETLRQLAGEGLSAKEIARCCEMSVRNVYSRCFRHGIPINPGIGARKRWAGILNKVREMPWLTVKELADECLCSKSLIEFVLRKKFKTSMRQLRREAAERRPTL